MYINYGFGIIPGRGFDLHYIIGRIIYIFDIVLRWYTFRIIGSTFFNYIKADSFCYVINVKNKGIDIRLSMGGEFVEKRLLFEWLVYSIFRGVGRKCGLGHRRGGDWPPLLGGLGGLLLRG